MKNQASSWSALGAYWERIVVTWTRDYQSHDDFVETMMIVILVRNLREEQVANRDLPDNQSYIAAR